MVGQQQGHLQGETESVLDLGGLDLPGPLGPLVNGPGLTDTSKVGNQPRRTLAGTGSMKRRPDSSLYRGAVKRSTAGERVVAVPPTLRTALIAHRKLQAAERLAAGKRWQDHGLVFCTDIGTPLDPANVRKVFAKVAEKAGLDTKGVVPYLLRHSVVISSSTLAPRSRKWPTCWATIRRRSIATTGTGYDRW